MSISEHYKKSVVDEARRTLRRLDAKLAEQPQEAAPSSVVDNNALWREQAAEIAHEQRQRNDDLEGLRRAQAQTAQDLVDAVRAVGGMGCCRK